MARKPRVESPKDSPAPHGPTPTDFTTFFNLGTEAVPSPDPTGPVQLMEDMEDMEGEEKEIR